ncbi:MAG: sigma-54-dependent Fis family transcriptional regulator [Deltaproteobacteria bacterium]|nr:sigma-54-dependent Fis family transcriptional regulator [Deltaproteobacteria bacterium]
MKRTIMIIDDEESIRQSLSGVLSDEGYDVMTAGSGEEGLSLLEEEAPDLVLLDIWLPGIDGIETLTAIKSQYPNIQVVMISGHGTVESAVKATKLGAFDFIEKPLSLEKVILTIANALEVMRLEEENRFLRTKFKHEHEITGNSKAIAELREMISIIAPTNAWILIMGENGTGKEVVARSIHRQSRRANRSFVEVNCAAIPEELIESELFGHEKGAFTGATAKKRGKFDLANQGTLFLDEVADMSLKAQAKILRILQEKKFERVGGTKYIETDVRVLAATNKDLEEEMGKGLFRQDLYYRLNVIPLVVPPLRERKEDIAVLTEKFVKEYSLKEGDQEKEIAPDAIDLLMEHDWPGNVRELKNIIERLLIMTTGNIIIAADIPPLMKGNPVRREAQTIASGESYRIAKKQFEKEFLVEKLAENDWNISKTADAIGLERTNLHRKIKSYNIEEIKKEQ